MCCTKSFYVVIYSFNKKKKTKLPFACSKIIRENKKAREKKENCKL